MHMHINTIMIQCKICTCFNYTALISWSLSNFYILHLLSCAIHCLSLNSLEKTYGLLPYIKALLINDRYSSRTVFWINGRKKKMCLILSLCFYISTPQLMALVLKPYAERNEMQDSSASMVTIY